MKRLWIIIGPCALVLVIGIAFAHMRLRLDRAEARSRVESKAGELNRSAMTCLSEVGSRLLVMRNLLPNLSRRAFSTVVNETLDIRQHCEAAVFATTGGQLVANEPELIREKYSSLPVAAWTPPAEGTEGRAAVMEGPYENASQEWYEVVRVPYEAQENSWIASVVPMSRLFDQALLKTILDAGIAVRISDFEKSDQRMIQILSYGAVQSSPLVRHELRIGKNAIVLEYSTALSGFQWQSTVVYGSLILIVAISFAAAGYEAVAEQKRLRLEVERRDRNVRELKAQVSQAIRGKTGQDSLSIGTPYQDAATGLPNWLYFSQHLERSLHRSSVAEGMTVVLSELDHLTDLQRHMDAQDIEALLRQVVGRFEGALRPEDLMATRLGQGEFAFLLFNSGHEDTEKVFPGKLTAALEEPFAVKEKTVILSVKSASSNSRQFRESHELIQQAEIELLKTKIRRPGEQNAGDPPSVAAPSESLELSNVKAAIERNELRLDYLPVVELGTRRIVGLEVLVRWHHPYKGIISPSRFVPLAEAYGHGVFLTKWVMNESVQQLVTWRRALNNIDDIYVSVNLTPHEFGRAGLWSLIDALLKETSLPGNLLHLELEEEILGGDVQAAVDLTLRLQQMGISLAFEEFGASHTALNSLRLVKWNCVKVARQFGSALSTAPEQQKMLRAVTHMAQDLGIDCAAKGVETELAANEFASLGYQYAQGFLFHKPLPSHSIEALLRQRSKA